LFRYLLSRLASLNCLFNNFAPSFADIIFKDVSVIELFIVGANISVCSATGVGVGVSSTTGSSGTSSTVSSPHEGSVGIQVCLHL